MTAGTTVGSRATLHRPDLRTEKLLLRSGCRRLAAMDEVGRGALAGPVSVGVVVITSRTGRVPVGLRDSKLLTPGARQALVPAVRRWAPEYAVGHAWPGEIDLIGIIAALRLAGRRALAALTGPVDAVLLDGNHDYLSDPPPGLFPGDEGCPAPQVPLCPGHTAAHPGMPAVHPRIPAVHLRIKADLACAGVAGASVLAKTERDALLIDLDPGHPAYQFAVNKGYGTPEHLAALRHHGPSEVHRRSWRLPGGRHDDPGDAR